MQWQPISRENLFGNKIHEIADVIINREFSINHPCLYYGNMGIALFLFQYAWQFDNAKAYEMATNRIKKTMAYIQLQSNTASYALVNNASFTDGLGGIAWGIHCIVASNIVEGISPHYLQTINGPIYKKMIENIRTKGWNSLNEGILSSLYCLTRNDRFSKEYNLKFIYELSSKFNAESPQGISPNNLCGLYRLLKKMALKYHDFIDITGLLNFIEITLYDAKKHILEGHTNLPIKGTDLRDIMTLSDSTLYRNEILYWLQENQDRLLNISERIGTESGLANGLAFTGHVANRLYQELHLDSLKKLSINCFYKLISEATYRDKVTNQEMWLTESQRMYGLHLGLYHGISGIGLSLLSTITNVEPQWDEILYLS